MAALLLELGPVDFFPVVFVLFELKLVVVLDFLVLQLFEPVPVPAVLVVLDFLVLQLFEPVPAAAHV